MKNIKLLQDEIHTSFDKDLFEDGTFESRITALANDHPVSHTNDDHMYTHITQELNKKYNFFGLDGQIKSPVDASFRPLEPRILFDTTEYFILLENGGELMTESSHNLLLE